MLAPLSSIGNPVEKWLTKEEWQEMKKNGAYIVGWDKVDWFYRVSYKGKSYAVSFEDIDD